MLITVGVNFLLVALLLCNFRIHGTDIQLIQVNKVLVSAELG